MPQYVVTAVLAPPVGASEVGISGLNDNGDVVGTARFRDSFVRAVVWKGGGAPIVLTRTHEF